MIIGIDFDGTCVTHEFPHIGSEIGATEVLKRIVAKGHELILITMRSDKKEVHSNEYGIHSEPDNYLAQALEWFKERGITIWGVNENPEQHKWTDSIKPYCHLYIDDSALGCPLKFNPSISSRPFVDWDIVEKLLKESKIL